MKSLLGFVLAAVYAAAIGGAYYLATHGGDDWTAGQWLYLVALPYTLSMVAAFGSVDLSAESTSSVLKAAAFCCALAYAAGAIVEFGLRSIFALAFRARRRA